VNRRAWILLLSLAALWGASYLFISIALDDLSPAMIVMMRCGLAALVLLPVALRTGAFEGLRPMAGPLVLLALVQVAAPFLLISAGQTEIPSSLAGILVASAPIFTAILAVWLDQSERLHGGGAVGVAIGIVGVGVLLGVDLGGDSGALLGGLAVVVASLGYAIGGFMLHKRFGSFRPIGIVVCTMGLSSLMAMPIALATPPDSVGLDTIGAITALGAGGTGIAFVIYYTLNASIGPTRTSLVAYVAPGFAVLYGVLLLDEKFSAGTALGLLLIVGGSWLAANSRRPQILVEDDSESATQPMAGAAPARTLAS
jgi:drug/metabolite transporter (DMT)-like permease